MNFLGVKKYKYDECNTLIIPYPKEAGVSYGRGTRNGPRAILKASQQVELHPYPDNLKIHTFTSLIGQAYQTGLPELSKMVIAGKEAGKFIMTLGGDHSITPTLFEPWANEDVDIIQFDAHCDLRDTYDGSKQSHACAMRRCMEINDKTNLFRFGIRNTSKSEEHYINKNKHRIRTNIIPENKKLYLTFDVDAFDISLMPATGTPEPGGYMWNETMHLLDSIIKYNEIVAVDVVEFAPIKGIEAYDFVVAKLCYEILRKISNSC